jgi:hypothetical protein
MITAGWTVGLIALTQWRKNEIVSVVPFDTSIHATGTPN